MLLTTLGQATRAEEQYIRRAADRRSARHLLRPSSCWERGRAVTVTETLQTLGKVTTGKHKVWIPTNGLAKVPPDLQGRHKVDSGDVSSSPRGSRPPPKASSKFTKRSRHELNALTAARMSPQLQVSNASTPPTGAAMVFPR